MKVCVYSANLGSFDPLSENTPQSVAHEFCLFTDENFPPRDKAMTPRMQARIVKMFGWQLVPDYDIYLWHDASVRLSNRTSVKWFMEKLGDAEMAVFIHPDRETVLDEADYLKFRLLAEKEGSKRPYVLPRYENEWIDDHLLEVDPNRQLLASTAFIYKNTLGVQQAMKRWWYYTSRYHIIDQLGFPEAIKNLQVNVMHEPYTKCIYLEPTR